MMKHISDEVGDEDFNKEEQMNASRSSQLLFQNRKFGSERPQGFVRLMNHHNGGAGQEQTFDPLQYI